MNAVYELAKKYYPLLWDKSRLRILVEMGKLTEEEYRDITGEGYDNNGNDE